MTDRREEIDAEILWFESLQDSIIEGDTESAVKAIQAAIDLLRRQREGEK